jgi:SAM-dependent methyltransferase
MDGRAGGEASIVPGYYTEKLAAGRLRACYEVAPPRVVRYLEAEIAFVLERTTRDTLALELGCGYGRVLERLVPRARAVAGIDTSLASLALARRRLGRRPSLGLLAADATCTAFHDRAFDLTLCIQNGICAFAADQLALLREAVRVTRPGGRVLFSSYAAGFWPDRLEWFEAQAAHGLIGPIDHAATGGGVITCKDGFRATTLGPDGFAALAARLGLTADIVEVDGSSLFCEIIVA